MAVSVDVCEIFSVEEWCDLENMVHSNRRQDGLVSPKVGVVRCDVPRLVVVGYC